MFYGLNSRQGERLMAILDEIGAMYSGQVFASDMMITLDRNAGFLEEPRFIRAFLGEVRNEQERSLAWRLHVLVWCADGALRREGDFVECGVYRGFSSAVAVRYLDFARLDRRWFLFDTFSGVPEDQLNPGNVNPEPFLDPELHRACVARFAHLPNVEVVRGRVPEILAGHAPERVAFLHLDMNSADAEAGALEFFFPRLSRGAYVLLDDYGWRAYREQKLVADEFFGDHGYQVLELPTGQGLVII
jgi:O-methyltransferase